MVKSDPNSSAFRVLQYVLKHPGQTRAQIAEGMGYVNVRGTIGNKITVLVELGLLTHELVEKKKRTYKDPVKHSRIYFTKPEHRIVIE